MLNINVNVHVYSQNNHVTLAACAIYILGIKKYSYTFNYSLENSSFAQFAAAKVNANNLSFSFHQVPIAIR